MQCPECGHANVPGSLFCEHCGADLPPSDAVVEPVAAKSSPVVLCPACGQENLAEYRFCEGCGRPLGERPGAVPTAEAPAPTIVVEEPPRRIETTPPLSQPPPNQATEPPRESPGQLVTGPRVGQVKLVVEQGMVVGKQYLLGSERMLVGREDAADGIFPDLDLTGMDEGYVHRRHAELTFEGSFLFVTHLGGHNRTYVNNRPIGDHLPHPLNIGDTVRFGKVVLRVVEA